MDNQEDKLSCFSNLLIRIPYTLTVPLLTCAQLTVEKRKKMGLLSEPRSCSAPLRRVTLPPFMALRMMSWKSLPQMAMEYPTDTDRAKHFRFKKTIFFIWTNLCQKSAASFSMFFVCRKHKVISGQRCKWYFIY